MVWSKSTDLFAHDPQVRLRDLAHALEDVRQRAPVHVLQHDLDHPLAVEGPVALDDAVAGGAVQDLQLVDDLLPHLGRYVQLYRLQMRGK